MFADNRLRTSTSCVPAVVASRDRLMQIVLPQPVLYMYCQPTGTRVSSVVVVACAAHGSSPSQTAMWHQCNHSQILVRLSQSCRYLLPVAALQQHLEHLLLTIHRHSTSTRVPLVVASRVRLRHQCHACCNEAGVALVSSLARVCWWWLRPESD